MRSYPIRRGPVPKRCGMPPEAKRLEIIRNLLALRHFHGIWYNGSTLSVRRFVGGHGWGGDIEYFSWAEAVELLEAAARIAVERKQVQGELFRSAGAGAQTG